MINLDELDRLEREATTKRWVVVKTGHEYRVYGLCDPKDIDLAIALRNAWPEVSREMRRLRKIEAVARDFAKSDNPCRAEWECLLAALEEK